MNTRIDSKPDIKPAIPEEDEKLSFHPSLGKNNVWAIKIPRFLLERWERVTEGGKELGTLVIDNSFVHACMALGQTSDSTVEPNHQKYHFDYPIHH
jgi:transcription initiation factor TFIIF subunit beta